MVSVKKDLVSEKVSVLVSKKFGIEKGSVAKSENIWYRKKYRNQYHKNLVPKKNLESVSFRFCVSSHTAAQKCSTHFGKLCIRGGGNIYI